MIALRPDDIVAHRGNAIPHQPHITALAAANQPQPTFEMHFFARLVHLAVIKNKPAQFIIHGAWVPAIAAPIVCGARQHGGIVAQAGCEVLNALIWDGEARHTFGIGTHICARCANAHTFQRFTIGQRGRPHYHSAGVSKGIQADLRNLHPGVNRLPIIILLEQATGRLGNHNKLPTRSAMQIFTKININFGQGI